MAKRRPEYRARYHMWNASLPPPLLFFVRKESEVRCQVELLPVSHVSATIRRLVPYIFAPRIDMCT